MLDKNGERYKAKLAIKPEDKDVLRGKMISIEKKMRLLLPFKNKLDKGVFKELEEEVSMMKKWYSTLEKRDKVLNIKY